MIIYIHYFTSSLSALLAMKYHFLYFLAVISYPLLHFFSVEAKSGGFTVEIIHRDSPLSPLYNHSATPGDLARNDVLRSIARAKHFRHQRKVESSVTPDVAEYLMKLFVGTPPVEILAVADTGSDLIWIQCEPCNGKCYPQDAPLFNSLRSSTYKELSCNSQPCHDLGNNSNCSTKKCGYTYSYGDKSYTRGVLATETLTFGNKKGHVAAFHNSIFGCGHDNKGLFSSRSSGLVGLGGGPLSLISQLGEAKIEKKFSYCLLPRSVNSTSKLKFGNVAAISGPGLVSTPLLFHSDKSIYYLNLEAVTVGTKRIPFSSSQAVSSKGGNIVIDSGTTLNIFEPGFYNQLEAAVKKVLVGLKPIQSVNSLCYDSNAFKRAPQMTMVFHFTGADVTLKMMNIFREIDPVTCLAMAPSPSGLGVSLYGNWAQMNFQVEYDLVSKQVSFAPADCTQRSHN